jgi:hypothetical protein
MQCPPPPLRIACLLSMQFDVMTMTGPILVFACVMPRFAFFTTDATDSDVGKYFVSLFSPTAFAFAAGAYHSLNIVKWCHSILIDGLHMWL